MQHLICKAPRCVLHQSNNVALQDSDWNLTQVNSHVVRHFVNASYVILYT